MVRKTKEDAAITRQRIIDAAREVFLIRGVSHTSMEQIAAQAGVTRGAIYWHFNSKAEIMLALRERVLLPLLDRLDDTLLVEGSEDPLQDIERFLCGTIHTLNDNLETRQTYEIMMVKCEYVGEFSNVMQETIANCANIMRNIEQAYIQARQKGLLRDTLTPEVYAQDTHLFFTGLLHMWVKDTKGTFLRQHAEHMIRAHIQLRRNHTT